MRICFVSRGSLNTFWDNYSGSDADVLFFGFQGLGEVSYEKELKGETNCFEDVAILSKESHNIVVCGCVTDTRGIKRKSAVVAENGRILGVSDMLNAVDGEFKSGAGLRVYETKAAARHRRGRGFVFSRDPPHPFRLRQRYDSLPFRYRIRLYGNCASPRGRVFLRRAHVPVRDRVQPDCGHFGRDYVFLARQSR